jgi:hypothetical protein
MKFQLPKSIISNNVIKTVLYLVGLSLVVSYIINEQSLAFISLIAITGLVYALSKSIVIALFIAIIITNLLLAMNYLKESNIIEGLMPIIEGNSTQVISPALVPAQGSLNITPAHRKRLQARAAAARAAHDAALKRGASRKEAEAAGVLAARSIV